MHWYDDKKLNANHYWGSKGTVNYHYLVQELSWTHAFDSEFLLNAAIFTAIYNKFLVC